MVLFSGEHENFVQVPISFDGHNLNKNHSCLPNIVDFAHLFAIRLLITFHRIDGDRLLNSHKN